MSVIAQQTNDDGTECIVYYNGAGVCTIIVGKPIALYTVKVKKYKLPNILRKIKQGKFKPEKDAECIGKKRKNGKKQK